MLLHNIRIHMYTYVLYIGLFRRRCKFDISYVLKVIVIGKRKKFSRLKFSQRICVF